MRLGYRGPVALLLSEAPGVSAPWADLSAHFSSTQAGRCRALHVGSTAVAQRRRACPTCYRGEAVLHLLQTATAREKQIFSMGELPMARLCQTNFSDFYVGICSSHTTKKMIIPEFPVSVIWP